jgi:histidine triad (HIT) family protein
MTCRFCNFVNGKLKLHRNKCRFIPLEITKHCISFLSIDHPSHEEEHILIIPKKHYSLFETIPKPVLTDLFMLAQKTVQVLKQSHQGCNLLINNGKAAGQLVHHCHLHIVPRDPKDHIHIEQWKRVHLSKEAFATLSYQLQKRYNQC